jgi:hypothetical protein
MLGEQWLTRTAPADERKQPAGRPLDRACLTGPFSGSKLFWFVAGD